MFVHSSRHFFTCWTTLESLQHAKTLTKPLDWQYFREKKLFSVTGGPATSFSASASLYKMTISESCVRRQTGGFYCCSDAVPLIRRKDQAVSNYPTLLVHPDLTNSYYSSPAGVTFVCLCVCFIYQVPRTSNSTLELILVAPFELNFVGEGVD